MTAGHLPTRVVPDLPRRRRGRYLIERNIVANKTFLPVLASGFFEPIFYLFAIGMGIGRLAGDVTVTGIPVDYAAFVAPAMLAASAMNGAISEPTNMFFNLKYRKTYDAAPATPMRAMDVATGEIARALIRGAFYSPAFLVVMVVMGLIRSPYGLPAFPATILIGPAFDAAGTAAITFMRPRQDLDLITLVTSPLFLFPATFYPIDVYPPLIQTITRISPLYHGVVLIRGLTLGILEWTMLVDVAYLAALGVAGSWVTARRIERLLLR